MHQICTYLGNSECFQNYHRRKKFNDNYDNYSYLVLSYPDTYCGCATYQNLEN